MEQTKQDCGIRNLYSIIGEISSKPVILRLRIPYHILSKYQLSQLDIAGLWTSGAQAREKCGSELEVLIVRTAPKSKSGKQGIGSLQRRWLQEDLQRMPEEAIHQGAEKFNANFRGTGQVAICKHAQSGQYGNGGYVRCEGGREQLLNVSPRLLALTSIPFYIWSRSHPKRLAHAELKDQ